jgi:D-alanyl-D-alanine carboxypeptidase
MLLGMRLGFAMRAGLLACVAFASGALCLAAPARAQIGSDRYSAIVLDSRTGNVLVAANPDEQRHPASLTKMMTLYMVFEAIREHRLSLESRVPISAEAASRPPSKLGVPAGQSISVEQAILALVTRSANDVATALGERLGGTEERFAQMMTLRARSLGMARTSFRNASGLPDPEQVTTARDMATLGRRLIQDFPDRYHYFGVTHAQFGNMRIRNHNRMLESYEGVDGIKTGYINASGFNIVTSANRGGQRLVGAVFGGSSWTERDQHMASLLDRGFDQLGVTHVARSGGTLVRSASAAALPHAAARRGAHRTATRQAAARQNVTRRAATRQAASHRPARAATRQAATRRASTRQASTRQAATRETSVRQGSTRTTATARASTSQPARTAPRSATTRASRPRASSALARADRPTLPAPTPRTSTVRSAELR